MRLLEGQPTGTAYILLFDDNDNAIVLLGGANQTWPAAADLERVGGRLHCAVAQAVVVMLQREVPPHVNLAAAKLGRALGVPVFMDVGGTDAPLDEALMPYLDVVAPNESELAFISGVETRRDDGSCDLMLVRLAVAALRTKFALQGHLKVEVLVTLGAQGSIHFGTIRETRMGRFALHTADGKPRDTTGAGDCYRGSYAGMRYGEGRSISEAMRWAAAAAACSVEVGYVLSMGILTMGRLTISRLTMAAACSVEVATYLLWVYLLWSYSLYAYYGVWMAACSVEVDAYLPDHHRGGCYAEHAPTRVTWLSPHAGGGGDAEHAVTRRDRGALHTASAGAGRLTARNGVRWFESLAWFRGEAVIKGRRPTATRRVCTACARPAWLRRFLCRRANLKYSRQPRLVA